VFLRGKKTAIGQNANGKVLVRRGSDAGSAQEGAHGALGKIFPFHPM